MQGKLAAGLYEVEWLWDLQDLVEAHLLLDWQERADEARTREGARLGGKAASR